MNAQQKFNAKTVLALVGGLLLLLGWWIVLHFVVYGPGIEDLQDQHERLKALQFAEQRLSGEGLACFRERMRAIWAAGGEEATYTVQDVTRARQECEVTEVQQ